MKAKKVLVIFTLFSIVLLTSIFSSSFIQQAHAATKITQKQSVASQKLQGEVHMTTERYFLVHPAIYPTGCSNSTFELANDDALYCWYGGGHLDPGVYVNYYYAGNWSGYFVDSNYNLYDFCNGWSSELEGNNGTLVHVTYLFLDPQKESWC